MKELVIVESPSKAKTIEKYLGKNYRVLSSKGHIRDLAIKGKGGLGVDVENGFEPTYEISKDKKEVVKQLQNEVAKASNVLLATDPDREGEAISWHLAEVLGLPEDVTNRIEFHEITKNAVLKAVNEPRKIDMNLVKSQETRRILDRIIGFKLSKLLQKKIKSKSAGRVQSVALKMICDREKEIEAFVPEEYWSISAQFEKSRHKFEASLSKIAGEKAEVHSREEADAVLGRAVNPFTVSSLKSSTKKRPPRLPFTTSTLQQEASTKLNFGAKKTMMVAQMLYEGIDIGEETQGLITYMRTDSTRMSGEFVASAMNYIEDEFGKEYKGFYRVKNDENSQDAHEAIRPTDIRNTPEKVKQYLTADQYKLYRFIYLRALASLMAPAKNDTVSCLLTTNDLEFTANGSVLIFDGYLRVYKEYDSSKDVLLPALVEGEQLDAKKVESAQHFTEPPARYTEAKLIKALEEEGIGRPSTYATVIDTIVKRNYTDLKKAADNSRTKVFFPTEQGRLTTEKLTEYFPSIINEKYTAKMVEELDEIALDNLDSRKALQEFYDKFMPLYEKADEKMEKKEPEKTGEKCPLCGSDLVIRSGRFGQFISCSNFPSCKYTANLNKTPKEEPEKTGKICPECGGELLKRKNRYGNYFLGCSNYPKCHYLENIEGEKPRFVRRRKKNEG
ncbi:MAG: type I DNA topoisomerase [Erysipelotrichaceae bacterium]|nr:type I DNA topoisomerase [Erysipelotrichaceae bacterium]